MMFYDTHNPLAAQLRHGVLPAVFLPAAALILSLVILTVAAPEMAEAAFQSVNRWILDTMGWFYALSVTGFLIFAILLASLKIGNIRLGPDHAAPDYSFTSWFAMLFSAGMGIGLMFFSVADPVSYYNTPPTADPRTIEAAREAMGTTFFHWGIHAWAVYVLVGLTLAYFGYRHKLPLTIRSALYPLIGDRIYGPIGHAVDIFAVLGTLFGVATSLGFGVAQVNSGLNYLLGVEQSVTTQILLIGGITAVATVSVVSGLDAGIKRLSELNLTLAALLLLFVVILGPTVLIMGAFAENLGFYVKIVLERSLRVGTYGNDRDVIDTSIFYWGWWISWSPFVGMFIARISRGRTIREFILGVLFVPTLLSFFWMTAFGNTALDFIANGAEFLVEQVAADNSVALFVFLEQLPLTTLVSTISVILVMTFFVTSSDSGSLIIDIITSGGSTQNPVWQRVFWAVSEGAVAAVLLLAGGLAALQSAALTTALPFTFVMVLAVFGLVRGLSLEASKARGADLAPDIAPASPGAPWRMRLNAILSYPNEKRIEKFMNDTVKPALAEVAQEIKSHDSAAEATLQDAGTTLIIHHEGVPDFKFAVMPKSYRSPTFAFADTDPDTPPREQFFRAEVHLSEGGQDYDIYGYEKDQIIHEVINHYNRHMHFLHLVHSEVMG